MYVCMYIYIYIYYYCPRITAKVSQDLSLHLYYLTQSTRQFPHHGGPLVGTPSEQDAET